MRKHRWVDKPRKNFVWLTIVKRLGDREVDYLHRLNLINTRWFSIKLHHIVLSDIDRDLHDHPWPFLSIILKGSYSEVWKRRGCLVERRVARRGSILRHQAEDLHKLTLRTPSVWSLVLTGPTRRDWGFATDYGWVPWYEYSGAGRVVFHNKSDLLADQRDLVGQY